MKIDLHCHTKQIKQGEKDTRDIPDNDLSYEEFIQSRIDENVGIVAITNHNHFDDLQFQKILNKANQKLLILPGVELDVLDFKKQSHGCNLIVSKSKKDLLNNFLLSIRGKENTFKITLNDFIELAIKWRAILLIDSREKGKDFPIEDINFIDEKAKQHKFFYAFEAANVKAASIVSNHDMKVIIGSDSDFWNHFNAEKLPQSNNQIINFEGLMTFLKSNYYYGTKITKEICMDILPEDKVAGPWEKRIKINLKSGVTIIVGPKASGKSVLLESIKKELEKEHITEMRYYGEENSYSEFEDEKIKCLLEEKLNIDQYFSNLKTSLNITTKTSFSNITKNWKNLIQWVKSEKHKLYSKLEELVDGPHTWTDVIVNQFNNELEEFFKDLSTIDSTNLILDKYELDTFDKSETRKYLLKVRSNIKEKMIKTYINYMKNKLINKTKNLLKEEISKKTNNISKPSKLGLFDFWLARTNLYDSIEKLNKLEEKRSEPVFVGDVIDELEKKKQIYINCVSFLYTEKYKKKYGSDIKISNKKASLDIFKALTKIKNNFLKNETLQDILELKKVLDEKKFTADRLVGYIIFYTKNNEKHTPSSGEKSFLLLSNILNNTNSNYFLLDEPEKSLDNKVVYDYIVERIQLLQTQNKYVILTTHSANIAINTHPKLIIYRKFTTKGKITLIGDSSSGTLASEDGTNKVSWREVSLSLLEGGEIAWNTRKEYYFNE